VGSSHNYRKKDLNGLTRHVVKMEQSEINEFLNPYKRWV